MQHKPIPPLAVGQTYRTGIVSGFDFTDAATERAVSGGEHATLRFLFPNETSIECPLRRPHLELLMCELMRAFPQRALTQLRHCVESADDDEEQAEGTSG